MTGKRSGILKCISFTVCSFFLLLTGTGLSQSSEPNEKPNAKGLKLLIDSIGAALSKRYIYPQKVPAAVSLLNANYKNGAYNTFKNTGELTARLNADLQQALKDGHMKLGYFPEEARRIESIKTQHEENAAREARLKTARENYFGFIKKEILPGNIGYIRWDHFDEFVNEGLPVFDSSFKALSKCQVLVLDLRNNSGGNPYMAYALQNYFFERRTGMNHIIDRTNDTVKCFTNPSKTTFKLNMPVYILTSNVTFSAGEDFTYSLQQAKRASTVGDTTGGGAHPTNIYSMGQGFVLAIPTKRSFNPYSKTDWELSGIYPDIATQPEDALGEVLLLTYKKLLSKAKSADEKKKLQEAISDVKKGRYATIPFSALNNSDAANAIEIRDSIYGPTNVCKGSGAVREYHEKTSFLDHGAPVYINEENSAWFKLRFNRDTTLTFDIVPVDPSNDYDFIFFKCADKDCIEAVKTGKVLPDRACHSGFDSYNGSTGLSYYSTSTQVGLGPGATYVRALPVKAGELYYLMVKFGENYIQEGITPYGFSIYFHDYWPKKHPVALNNVNFNSNSFTLLSESFPELDRLATQLKKEKNMYIEIRGHADSQGSEEKNVALSVQRAQAVKDYLVTRKIDAKRLVCKGFGSSKPLAGNSSETDRKKNRRVEVAVIMK